MTRFEKHRFHYSGGFLHYVTEAGERKFVARFKRQRKDKPGFQAFLIRHFTVEEYFALYEQGFAPARILQTKGYVSKTIQEILTERGFEPTQEGMEQYFQSRR